MTLIHRYKALAGPGFSSLTVSLFLKVALAFLAIVGVLISPFVIAGACFVFINAFPTFTNILLFVFSLLIAVAFVGGAIFCLGAPLVALGNGEYVQKRSFLKDMVNMSGAAISSGFFAYMFGSVAWAAWAMFFS